MIKQLLGYISVILIGAVACTPSGSEIVPSGESTTVSVTTVAAPTRAATATEAVVSETLSVGTKLGLPGIELITAESGGGTRPMLEWEVVEGADHYFVSVRTIEGNGYWGWRTEQTSVPVGGLPRLAEDAPGPRIALGMTWSVIAMDVDGNMIAASNYRPIAP